jgi:drug/metabolite transporter (DMT)-like permease
MLVTFLLPISALLLGVFFLGETITLQAIGGMALIGMGLAAIDGRLWAAGRRRWLLRAPAVTARSAPHDRYDS